MTKRLTRIGSSYGVIIDKPILELLRFTPDTELELSTDGDRLILKPIRAMAREQAPPYGDDDRAAMRRAAADVAELYADTFRKLAK